MDQPIRLRAHHVLCLLGFRGKGYNEAFVRKLYDIIALVQDDPRQTLIIIDYPDIICSSCPLLGCYGCGQGFMAAVGIRRRDRKVLDLLGYRSGDNTTITEINRRICQNMPSHFLDKLCKGCEWLKLGACKQGIVSLKESQQKGPYAEENSV